MINMWSDKRYLRSLADMRPILMPFWGEVKDPTDPTYGRFDKWKQDGTSVFQMASLGKADAVIYPQDPTIDRKGFVEFQQITGDKLLLVFFNSDSEEKLNVRPNTWIFRTSASNSKKEPYEFGLAAWSEDWGQLPKRPKVDKPTVGFCGQDARPNIRKIGLDMLEKDNRVSTNFIRTNKFWGGWLERGRKEQDGKALRQKFIDNMRDSDYVFCARGGGNFSYRLYETFMSGRVPILVDTDCLLPQQLQNLPNLFPIVKQNEIHRIGDILMSYHAALPNFEATQDIMRKTWEDILSPTGFFKHIAGKIERR